MPSNRVEHDVFISHAWEDTDAVARPLAEELRRRGLRVWYDEFSLRLGDSLRRSIDRGLARSRFGVVILSPSFFAKEWTQYELDGLLARQTSRRRKIILPVWANIAHGEVVNFSPKLADLKAVRWGSGLSQVVDEITRVVTPPRPAALRSGVPNHLLGNDHGLTVQEANVAYEISRGSTSSQIALNMGVSIPTIHAVGDRIRRKFGVRSNAEVAALWLKQIRDSELGRWAIQESQRRELAQAIRLLRDQS